MTDHNHTSAGQGGRLRRRLRAVMRALAEGGPGATRGRGRVSRHFSQRGFAILAVAVALVLATALSVEFTGNTRVDNHAAANIRNDMRAHFLARSGVNLAQMVIRVQQKALDPNRQYVGDLQFADFAPMFMGAFGGSPDEVQSFSALLGGLDGESIKALGTSGGSFEIAITTEDDKININCAGGNDQTRKTLQAQLQAVMYFDAFNPIFENGDAEGYRRTRDEQVAALMDYIDRDTSRSDSPGAPEDYGYETLKDRYRAKDNYIDSVDELKLVRGVDDRFWTLFGNIFTAYGGCKINLAAISDPKLIAAVIFLSAKNADDPVVRDAQKLWKLAKRTAESKAMGVYFDEPQQFADFVKDPNGFLGELAGGETNPDALALQAVAGGLEPVEGVELDIGKLGQVARTGPRRTYRIESTATTGTFTKRITAIFDTQGIPQNSRDQSGSERGFFVYWRED